MDGGARASLATLEPQAEGAAVSAAPFLVLRLRVGLRVGTSRIQTYLDNRLGSSRRPAVLNYGLSSARTGFVRTPTRSISTLTSSPGARKRGGVRV
jgi:hypothetical protein